MCTVTFIPRAGSGFILTSNRDEHTSRQKALPPSGYEIGHEEVYFPKDKQAGGTWIASGESGNTLCLLNGARVPHQRKESYRLSRGLALLDYFRFNDPEKFSSNYKFQEIEPFTLIILSSKSNLKLYQLTWDGSEADLLKLDENNPKVWSSVTLYDPEVIVKRREWFYSWCQANPVPSQNDIIDFHKSGGTGDSRNDLLMNRDNVLYTVSITSILKNDADVLMQYIDMTDHKNHSLRFTQHGVTPIH